MLTAVVVTYNRRVLLEECLTALLGQTRPLQKIIVVDNASSDGTDQVLDSFLKKVPDKITVLRNVHNEGGAFGFHQGIEAAYAAQSEWIWVLDDDAIPKGDALENLLTAPQARDIDTGALGCLVLDAGSDLFLPNFQCRVDREKLDFKPIASGEERLALRTATKTLQADTNSFVGMLLHRRAIDAVGFPKKDFFIWYDDIEYSLRVSAKLKIWVVTNSHINHKAVARDFEKKHPLFRAKVPVYPWKDCWRMYYGTRNQHVLARGFQPTLKFHIGFGKRLVKDLLVPVLFRQDHLIARERLVVKAHWDGYFKNLGRTIKLEPPFIIK